MGQPVFVGATARCRLSVPVGPGLCALNNISTDTILRGVAVLAAGPRCSALLSLLNSRQIITFSRWLLANVEKRPKALSQTRCSCRVEEERLVPRVCFLRCVLDRVVAGW